MAFPLGQLVDLLPDWGWKVLFGGGLLAPLAAWLIASLYEGFRPLKVGAVAAFYAVSLPIARSVIWMHSGNPVLTVMLLLLTPIGLLLCIVILTSSPRRGPK